MKLEPENRVRVGEFLELDLNREEWLCSQCGHALGPARENYKHGCLVAYRDPRSSGLFGGDFALPGDPTPLRRVDFHCPGCAIRMETEYLATGQAIAKDIEFDLERVKERARRGELAIRRRKLA